MGTEFNKAQFDAIYPDGIEHHYWNDCRNKILAHTLNSAKAKSNILEVGCGKGIVSEYLHNAGFKIQGVELADVPTKDELKAYVRTNLSVFDLNESESMSVETVLLLDVIEHIEKPKEFISAIRQKFPNLKRFIVTVPARQEIFSNYDTFNGHFRRYDISTLKDEFGMLNPKSLKCSYFFHALYWPARILVDMKKKRPEYILAPKSILQKRIHKILATVFYLEYFIMPSSFKGSSLIIKVEL